MDKLFMVLGNRHGYSKILFGVFNNKSLAERRITRLKLTYQSLDEFEIREITINTEIELDF